MRCRYKLQGPHAGASGHFGHFDFIDGVTVWRDRPLDQWEKLDKQQLKFHSSIRETQENDDGSAAIQSQSDVQPDRIAPAAPPDDVVATDAEADTGSSGGEAAAPSGSGRAAQSVSLQAALDTLDPAKDEHWNPAGKPSVTYLRAVTGQKILRGEIDMVAPWMTRGYLAAHTAEQR